MTKYQPSWISISEKSPASVATLMGGRCSGALVVLTSDNAVVTAVWCDGVFVGDFGFWGTSADRVTHWIPAPKFPPERR